MHFASGKKTETHETFITPDQFEQYTKSGYVIFMTSPTPFGTYKAIKIQLVDTLPFGNRNYSNHNRKFE
jgi:hypothetical protein